MREIVKRGANVNFRLPKGAPKQPDTSSSIGSEGATPFLFAADRADVPLMRLLLELGADPLLPNFNNTTPLMAAAGVGTNEPQEEAGEESEALEAVKMLLDLGADVNTVDNNGDTAMHGAAYNISPLVVKLLAERGADPQIWKNPNKAGGTPLFIAEGYISRLPRPDAPTIEAITKLMLAAGISTEGERPKIVDSYEKPAPRPSLPNRRSERPSPVCAGAPHHFWALVSARCMVRTCPAVRRGSAPKGWYLVRSISWLSCSALFPARMPAWTFSSISPR